MLTSISSLIQGLEFPFGTSHAMEFKLHAFQPIQRACVVMIVALIPRCPSEICITWHSAFKGERVICSSDFSGTDIISCPSQAHAFRTAQDMKCFDSCVYRPGSQRRFPSTLLRFAPLHKVPKVCSRRLEASRHLSHT